MALSVLEAIFQSALTSFRFHKSDSDNFQYESLSDRISCLRNVPLYFGIALDYYNQNDLGHTFSICSAKLAHRVWNQLFL